MYTWNSYGCFVIILAKLAHPRLIFAHDTSARFSFSWQLWRARLFARTLVGTLKAEHLRDGTLPPVLKAMDIRMAFVNLVARLLPTLRLFVWVVWSRCSFSTSCVSELVPRAHVWLYFFSFWVWILLTLLCGESPRSSPQLFPLLSTAE